MRGPTLRRVGVLIAVITLVATVAAVAAPLGAPAPEPLPRIAFVARDDVPFDALGVGPVAGALGGIVAITQRDVLSPPAADALTAFAPDAVYLAGGTAALAPAVADAVADICNCTPQRLAGADRRETAELVAAVLDDLGVGRPVLTGTQVEGDVYVGGHLAVDTLSVHDPADPLVITTRHFASMRADATDGPEVWISPTRNVVTVADNPADSGTGAPVVAIFDLPRVADEVLELVGAELCFDEISGGDVDDLFITLERVGDTGVITPVGIAVSADPGTTGCAAYTIPSVTAGSNTTARFVLGDRDYIHFGMNANLAGGNVGLLSAALTFHRRPAGTSPMTPM